MYVTAEISGDGRLPSSNGVDQLTSGKDLMEHRAPAVAGERLSPLDENGLHGPLLPA